MDKKNKEVYFISGIDTDAGKSYATGWLARRFMEQGRSVITQKFIQTGCSDASEDIEVHRRIMGTGMLPEDLDHTTAPIIFTYPASPQLAARIDGREIDLKSVDKALRKLKKSYEVVLIEGAGGLMVPLADDMMTIDFPSNRNIPVILVTNGRLGSINHTVLALEAIKRRNMQLRAVIYNEHFDYDSTIAADTYGFIERYLRRKFKQTELIRVPSIDPKKVQPMEMPKISQPDPLQLSISKLQLAELPKVTFPGTISVIEHRTQALEAIAWLSKQKIVGFDTETRPSFRKGRMNNPALIQVSTARRCFLFRINKLGMIPELLKFFESEKVKKVGLSLKDDYQALRRVEPKFTPGGFIELQDYVKQYHIVDASLQKIYGIIFGKRISKSQRLSNWEADKLSEAQQIYAAIDAWASLRIYQTLESGKFDPEKSEYKLTPQAPE